MKNLSLLLCLLLLPLTTLGAPENNARQLLQLVDYVGVDYAVAVADGKIISQAEYAEMQNFSTLIDTGIAALPQTAGSQNLQAASQTLAQQIDNKAAPEMVADTARTIRELLMRHYDVVSLPNQAPDLTQGAALYAANCAACHGAQGFGDGPAAAGLEPAPTNFHNADRATQRSLFGLYNTISLGVEGTAMTSFAHLSDAERWALAFYVGGLYADDALLVAGNTAWAANPLSLEQAITAPPAEIVGQGAALSAYARHNPAALFAGQPGPLDLSISRLQASLAQYKAGNTQAASQLAVSAYLDGFEMTEAALSNVAPDLVLDVEHAMLNLRNTIASGAPVPELEADINQTINLLDQARETLTGSTLSAGVAFTSSLIILLREGLEAILILAAIAAFLIKTERRDALRYMHFGWAAALALGVATWFLSTYLITISGAVREVTEGITALIAAGVLFYVGFWMHNKLNAQRWNQFLKNKVQAALDQQALWTIALMAFLAVYREVFETVLFYQALWAQVTVEAHSAVFGGAAAAVAMLGLLTWGIFKFGLRLPLKQFFAISAGIMFVLAVIFAGKGIVALQEAGKLPITTLEFLPRVELLGLYPNLQSIGLQAVLISIALLLIFWNRRPVAA